MKTAMIALVVCSLWAVATASSVGSGALAGACGGGSVVAVGDGA